MGALKIRNGRAGMAEQESGLGVPGSLFGNEEGVFLDRETLVVFRQFLVPIQKRSEEPPMAVMGERSSLGAAKE